MEDLARGGLRRVDGELERDTCARASAAHATAIATAWAEHRRRRERRRRVTIGPIGGMWFSRGRRKLVQGISGVTGSCDERCSHPMNDPANVSLFVDDRGAGTPVVLLHSGGMSSRQWRSLAERLAANHRVLAPDLLGSGKNPPWPGDLPFGYELDVAAVARVLDRVDGAVHLVGHSYGGLVALTLARHARAPGALAVRVRPGGLRGAARSAR